MINYYSYRCVNQQFNELFNDLGILFLEFSVILESFWYEKILEPHIFTNFGFLNDRFESINIQMPYEIFFEPIVF